MLVDLSSGVVALNESATLAISLYSLDSGATPTDIDVLILTLAADESIVQIYSTNALVHSGYYVLTARSGLPAGSTI